MSEVPLYKTRMRHRRAPVASRHTQKFHMQTLIIYKLGFNQNYYTITLNSLIKIVRWSKFLWTQFRSYKCVDEWFYKVNFPTKSLIYCLLLLNEIISWRFCGGVDFLKPFYQYTVRWTWEAGVDRFELRQVDFVPTANLHLVSRARL